MLETATRSHALTVNQRHNPGLLIGGSCQQRQGRLNSCVVLYGTRVSVMTSPGRGMGLSIARRHAGGRSGLQVPGGHGKIAREAAGVIRTRTQPEKLDRKVFAVSIVCLAIVSMTMVLFPDGSRTAPIPP